MDYQLTKQELRTKRPDRKNYQNFPKFPIVCILHNLKCLFNIGSIIKTCEAFRIEKLIICSGNEINVNNKKIKKIARDSLKWLNIEVRNDIFNAIKELKDLNYTIIAVELTKNAKNYKNADYQFPLAFIFGNEQFGIDDEIIAKCDYSVQIELFGMVNSLNVSVCAGIIISDAINKFLKIKKI